MGVGPVRRPAVRTGFDGRPTGGGPTGGGPTAATPAAAGPPAARQTAPRQTAARQTAAGLPAALRTAAVPTTPGPTGGRSFGRPWDDDPTVLQDGVGRGDPTRPQPVVVAPPLPARRGPAAAPQPRSRPRTAPEPLAPPEPSVLVRSRKAAHQQPTKPVLRHTMIASAAAVGAVATGSLATLLPASAHGASVAAAADETPTRGTLSAATTALLRDPDTTAIGTLAPVAPRTDGFDAANAHLSALGKGADIAKKIADDAAKAQAAAAEKARLDRIVAHGGVDGWIAEALRILHLPQSYAPGVKKIIMAESGGNPYAINLTDSNAARGTPSQGLMQTIPVTFRHYVAPSLAGRPITDPVANITAGVNYMVANYGSGTLAAGGRTNAAGAYIGY